MKRLVPLLALLSLAACGSQPAPNGAAKEKPGAGTAAPAPAPEGTAPPSRESASEIAGAGDAAGVLSRYYALIEKGDYGDAARLRSDRTVDAARLADNFKAYRTYHVALGTPGRPVEAAGWVYVRVPVMITGSFKGGKGFGSAGSVTVRRATGAGAAPGDRQWRVYTG